MSAINYRLAAERDHVFITHGWVSAFGESHYSGPFPSWASYRRTYFPLVAEYLARPGVVTVVAEGFVDDGEPVLVGFACVERAVFDKRTSRDLPAIHFVYVKQGMRRNGIASRLLAATGVDPRTPFLFAWKLPLAVELCRSLGLRGTFAPLSPRFTPKNQPPKETP